MRERVSLMAKARTAPMPGLRREKYYRGEAHRLRPR
jgi:hypothetical protein